jgi:hypothetical protein
LKRGIGERNKVHLFVQIGAMAAAAAHCQQLVDKLRVLSASDDAAKIEQARSSFA